MHLYTLVITPGPRRRAVDRAYELLNRAARGYCDYWRTGGRFSERLGRVERPEIDAWYAAQAERRKRWEAENPLAAGGAPEDADLREVLWRLEEGPRVAELRRLERRARIDLARLTSQLPSPLPESIVPEALVTPDASWHICPVGWERCDPRWARFVNEEIDRYRGGHCVVVADCHY